MVKSEADVPDFTSQLILFAVCVTKVMLPSAVSIRVLKLFTVCVRAETDPSAFSIRVLKPPTVWDSVDTAPSAFSMRVLKPLTVCESVERSPSTVWMLDSSFPSAALNSCRTRSIWVAVEARRFGT